MQTYNEDEKIASYLMAENREYYTYHHKQGLKVLIQELDYYLDSENTKVELVVLGFRIVHPHTSQRGM